MAQLEVLVLELVAIDRLATSAYSQLPTCPKFSEWTAQTITLGEVTTLNHKVLDDTVESRALVAEALLASGQSPNKSIRSNCADEA